jgi:hypothetical protein
MQRDDRANGARGLVCPRCGGTLRERRNGGPSGPEPRIGDPASAARLWIEQCTVRNRALLEGTRALADNAALARRLAAWARGRGDLHISTRLDEEARMEDECLRQVQQMLDGLEGTGPGIGG